MDFYAFLPSNASTDLYPENKTSNYKIQLSKRIDLTGRWQISLVEAHYPNTFAQVTEGENKITLKHKNGEQDTYFVQTGYYARVNDFIFALHEALTPIESLPESKGRSSVVQLSHDNHILFHPFQNCLESTYSFSPRLAMQLGLTHAGPYPAKTELCGQNPVDLSLGIPPQLFIYFDKIADQICGHYRVPLLRTVPTDTTARYGSSSIYRFEQPLYLDLNTKCFDTIEINIRDHTGKLAPFTHGTSMLVVHFKPLGE